MKEQDSKVFFQELKYFTYGTKVETRTLTNVGDMQNKRHGLIKNYTNIFLQMVLLIRCHCQYKLNLEEVLGVKQMK